MSDFNLTEIHDSLPHKAQPTPEFHDHVVQQDPVFGDNMLLDAQRPVEQPPQLLGRGDQQDLLSDNAILFDDQPSVDQSPELLNYGAEDYVAQDEINFDPYGFERDIAEINRDPAAWWVRNGASVRSDGTIDFGPSFGGPVIDFETGSTSHPVDTTAQAPSVDHINSSGIGGVPTTLDTTQTDVHPEEVFAQPGTGSSHHAYPTVSHPLPYSFDWGDVTQRQLRALGGNGPGQFITNSGTGTVLEAIPEIEARLPGSSPSPPTQPSNVDYLDIAARSLTTPSPSPTLQTAPIKRNSTDRRQTLTTGRNQPAVKFPIYKDALLVQSFAEAKQTANTRIKLNFIDNDDDRDAVAFSPESWIPLITKAFDSGFLVQPDDGTKLTAEGEAEWTRWQSEHENKVWHILASHSTLR